MGNDLVAAPVKVNRVGVQVKRISRRTQSRRHIAERHVQGGAHRRFRAPAGILIRALQLVQTRQKQQHRLHSVALRQAAQVRDGVTKRRVRIALLLRLEQGVLRRINGNKFRPMPFIKSRSFTSTTK